MLGLWLTSPSKTEGKQLEELQYKDSMRLLPRFNRSLDSNGLANVSQTKHKPINLCKWHVFEKPRWNRNAWRVRSSRVHLLLRNLPKVLVILIRHVLPIADFQSRRVVIVLSSAIQKIATPVNPMKVPQKKKGSYCNPPDVPSWRVEYPCPRISRATT